jgi:hypothetical protein
MSVEFDLTIGELRADGHEAAQGRGRQLMKEQETNNRAIIDGPSWSASELWSNHA